ncbi:30S ribosomal protein S9 [Candidatus Parcubacteria bacterium]|nr:MAG: 30S ribosomal protein S9 [Candidatus Parcubacteria bacterium]
MDKKETTNKKEVTEEKAPKTPKADVKDAKFKGKYTYAVGRRKTSVAQVRIYKSGKGVFVVNGMSFQDYFTDNYSEIATQALDLAGLIESADLSVVVSGGGKKAQAEATRHGVSRALLLINEELKPSLKAKGWTTRDSRSKERKKPGLKKARKAPQWSKR